MTVRQAIADKEAQGYNMANIWEAYEARKAELTEQASQLTSEQLTQVVQKAINSQEWKPKVMGLIAEDVLQERGS